METPDQGPNLAGQTEADPALPSDPPSPVLPTLDRMSFTGDGYEYFRIWIVNVALTILTLGFYSPWAKVRRLQYFYRNTRLAGASFDYHGDPVAILKGRLIAGALFLLYSFAGVFDPMLGLGVVLAIAAVMPWLLSRSLRFKLRNSSYRGLRFRFSGSTRSAYWVFLALPILMVLSLLTLFPFWQHRMKRYQYNHAWYGQVPFSFNARVGDFYLTYLLAALLVFGLFAALGTVIAVIAGAAAVVNTTAAENTGARPAEILLLFGIAVGVAIYVLGVLTVQAFVAARLRNLVWNGTTLGPRTFVSHLQARTLLWLTLTNLVGTILSLGLFWPFAQVRLVRYLTETFSTEGTGSFEEFIATASSEEQAVGEAVAEFFDFDVAF